MLNTPSATPLPSAHSGAPSSAPQHLLGEFSTYEAAERVIDKLSDNGFPVERCRIVGTGLRTVEQVTGRLTSRGAAAAGAASGAWFGLLFGLLVGLFGHGSAWVAIMLGSVLISAVWMGLFGFVAHRATRGHRDFQSTKNLQAEQYAVHVDASHADDAIRLAGLF
jgi:hypothetical protein